MSEYQYYEFRAVDRPLDDRQMQRLRVVSSRMVITPTSFVNEYSWVTSKKDSLNKLPFRFPIQAASRRDNFR